MAVHGFCENKCKHEVYTKDEVDTKLIDYKLNGDFVILTGTMKLEANTEESLNNGEMKQTILNIDFPQGFNRDNCLVLSFGGRFYETKGYIYGDISGSSRVSTALFTGAVPKAIHLGGTAETEYENKIQIEVYNASTTEKDYQYKIVLLKQ